MNSYITQKIVAPNDLVIYDFNIGVSSKKIIELNCNEEVYLKKFNEYN